MVQKGGIIMYNPLLKTFYVVADSLSFSKAAEKLYMTPPGVIRQINALEEHIGTKLFIRTHRGLVLTAAGKELYKEVPQIIAFSNQFLQHLRSMDMKYYIIRIAVSTKTSTSFLRHLEKLLKQHASEFRFKLIPFSVSASSFIDNFKNLGVLYDIIPGIYDEENIRERNCNVLPLFQAHICCAVSVDNALSQKKEISFSDLKGQTVMMIKRGWNLYMDRMRDVLEKEHPDIPVVDIPVYDTEAFNECQNNNYVLLTTDAWSAVHPLLKLVLLKGRPEIPYGLMYAKDAQEPVRQFVKIIQDNLKKENN